MWADDSRPDLDIAEIGQRLRDLREQLARGTERPEPEPDGLGTREPDGSAETSDGLIRVEAARGRLRSIQLDSRVMRMPSAQLADQVTTTSNAALEQAASRSMTDTGPVVDFDALAQQLQDAQNEGLRQMDRMVQGLYGAVEVIRRRAVVRGEVDSGGLEHLLEETARGVNSLRRPSSGPPADTGEEAERDRFTAYGLDGLIVVTTRSASRLDEIDIADRAMRRPSPDIATEIVRAANDALQLAHDAALSTVRQVRSDFAARVAQLQDASAEQMGTLTASLSKLIGSIDRP